MTYRRIVKTVADLMGMTLREGTRELPGKGEWLLVAYRNDTCFRVVETVPAGAKVGEHVSDKLMTLARVMGSLSVDSKGWVDQNTKTDAGMCQFCFYGKKGFLDHRVDEERALDALLKTNISQHNLAAALSSLLT